MRLMHRVCQGMVSGCLGGSFSYLPYLGLSRLQTAHMQQTQWTAFLSLHQQ